MRPRKPSNLAYRKELGKKTKSLQRLEKIRKTTRFGTWKMLWSFQGTATALDRKTPKPSVEKTQAIRRHVREPVEGNNIFLKKTFHLGSWNKTKSLYMGWNCGNPLSKLGLTLGWQCVACSRHQDKLILCQLRNKHEVSVWNLEFFPTLLSRLMSFVQFFSTNAAA